MKRYDIEFETTYEEDGETHDSAVSVKLVSDKSFVEMAELAESMVGKTKDGETIVAVQRLVRRSDVEVV